MGLAAIDSIKSYLNGEYVNVKIEGKMDIPLKVFGAITWKTITIPFSYEKNVKVTCERCSSETDKGIYAWRRNVGEYLEERRGEQRKEIENRLDGKSSPLEGSNEQEATQTLPQQNSYQQDITTRQQYEEQDTTLRERIAERREELREKLRDGFLR